MNEEQKRFFKEVSNIVHKFWDPIGVSLDEAGPKDEYDSYVPSICKLAMEDKSADDISVHLSAIQEDKMGLEPNKKHNDDVACKIVEAKIDILG